MVASRKELTMPKLGSPGHPVVIRVQTMERANELSTLCDDHGIKFIIGIEPDKPEHLGGLERLLAGESTPPATMPKFEPKIGRNDPCPCGSGRKFKKCCGGK